MFVSSYIYIYILSGVHPPHISPAPSSTMISFSIEVKDCLQFKLQMCMSLPIQVFPHFDMAIAVSFHYQNFYKNQIMKAIHLPSLLRKSDHYKSEALESEDYELYFKGISRDWADKGLSESSFY
jgi:hypothetical protein